jgi:hypothetical protein
LDHFSNILILLMSNLSEDSVKKQQAAWMDMLRLLQDGSCKGMWNVLMQNDLPDTTDLPPEAEPLLRTFWRHMKGLLTNKPVGSQYFITDLEMQENKPTSATLTLMPLTPTGLDFDDSKTKQVPLHFFNIVCDKKVPGITRQAFGSQVVDYCAWHHPCSKRCMSCRVFKTAPSAKPLMNYLARIHPDLPLPDFASLELAMRTLEHQDSCNEPNHFSACVDYIYKNLNVYYPEWEVRRLPYGIPYITSPDTPHDKPAPRPGEPGFLTWCMPFLRDPKSLPQRYQKRMSEYRLDVRTSLLLALHPRVGQNSPLYRTFTQSPYGGALLQMLPQMCDALGPAVCIKNKRNKAVKRPRDE